MPDVRPPMPGPIVQPNFLSVEEAVRHVPFPISKKDLLEQIDDEASALLGGRNVDLRDIIKDLRDDFFATEDEFREALEREYGPLSDEAEAEARPLVPGETTPPVLSVGPLVEPPEAEPEDRLP